MNKSCFVAKKEERKKERKKKKQFNSGSKVWLNISPCKICNWPTSLWKDVHHHSVQFCSVAQSCLTLFNPWTAARQAFLSITNTQSLLKLMSIKLVMTFNHLILYRPLLLTPSIFPSLSVFSNESALCIRWPKSWRFSFSISPSNEYSGLISSSLVIGKHKSNPQDTISHLLPGLLLFSHFLARPCGIWNLSSPTMSPALAGWSLNHWTIREVPRWLFEEMENIQLDMWEMFFQSCTYMCMLSCFSCVRLCNLWTVAYQYPLSMGFFSQEYQSGLPSHTPGDLSDSGWNPHLLCLLH